MSGELATNEATRIEATVATSAAQRALQFATDLVIDGPETYRQAAEELKAVAAASRTIDAERKKATRPLDEAKQTIIGWWRQAVDDTNKAIVCLRRKIEKYDAERSERELAAAREAAQALIAGKPLDHAKLSAVFSDSPGVTIRKTWKARVVDFAALPDEYKTVNEQKLNAVARALKADTKIPGVEVYEDKTAALTGKE